MEKKIYIKGMILITTSQYKCKDMIAKADESYAEGAEIIEGDLVIDDNYETSADTIYIASEGITAIGNCSIPDTIDDILKIYESSIYELQQLLTLEISNSNISFTRFKYIFVGIFGAMEAFLCDVCRCYTLKEEKYMKSYLKANTTFKNEKMNLIDIFDKYSKINNIIDERIQSTLYYNLWVVKDIFQKTFNISFPNINDITPYVATRHNIVHRNGRTPEGKPIYIDRHKIEELISKVNILVSKVAYEIKNTCCVIP